MAEIEAPAAAVADVVDALKLREQGGLVMEIRILPVERMALRRFETAFLTIGVAAGHVGDAVAPAKPVTARWVVGWTMRPAASRDAAGRMNGEPRD
jgi:hypothetical protein